MNKENGLDEYFLNLLERGEHLNDDFLRTDESPLIKSDKLENVMEYPIAWTDLLELEALKKYGHGLMNAKQDNTFTIPLYIKTNEIEPSTPDHFPRHIKSDIDRMAIALFDAFKVSEPENPIVCFPASYVATFADMARAALTIHPVIEPVHPEIDLDKATQNFMDAMFGNYSDPYNKEPWVDPNWQKTKEKVRMALKASLPDTILIKEAHK
jgi:hypothetical protein